MKSGTCNLYMYGILVTIGHMEGVLTMAHAVNLGPHIHEDATNLGFWNPPLPWTQKVGSSILRITYPEIYIYKVYRVYNLYLYLLIHCIYIRISTSI